MDVVKSFILCEGETDQILLGYYLGNRKGWMYQRNLNNRPFPNEKINYFRNDSNRLLGIWSVDGNDFSSAINSIFEREKQSHSIEKIAIITDHDDSIEVNDRLESIVSTIANTLGIEEGSVDIAMNHWSRFSFNDAFNQVMIEILFLLVPNSETGALETFMMNAISEQSKEKDHVISEARRFISEFESEVYLRHRRERVKAELGVALSVFSPDKVFTTMNELIGSVCWNDFYTTREQFHVLDNMK